MSFKATLLTLYPEMFPGTLGYSLAGKAAEEGRWSCEAINLRKFGEGKHKKVDDTPTGGGAGLVMSAEPIAKAIDEHICPEDMRPKIMMSPRGKPLNQAKVRELAQGEGAIILCGRFEGIDQRVIDHYGFEEISIGDYVLSGGEPAALVLLDSVVRLLPEVMGSPDSEVSESFENGLLEYPQYTKPRQWRGKDVPEILLSGDHGAIEKWRHQQSLKLTKQRRPELHNKFLKS